MKRTMVLMTMVAVASLGCGRTDEEGDLETPEPEPAAAAAEHAEHAEHAAEAPPLPAVPDGASITFVSPAADATIQGPLTDGKVQVHVQMGAEGIRVMPAGEVVPGAGHHHIIIDGQPVPQGEAVPADDTHIHFGGGQTETDVALAPGKHTLTLQFADGLHRSYGPALSSSIGIEIVGADDE